MTATRIRGALAIAFLSIATTAQAQKDTTVRIDEHWRAYIGCWATSAGGVSGPMICVVPTSSVQTVEFVTVVGDSIVSRSPVTASGAKVERAKENCTGWESGRWSADERRLYTHAEYTCPGGVAQRQDGMLTMVYADGFSRIEGLRTRGGTRTRLVHFTLEVDSTLYPAAVAARIPSVTSMQSFGVRLEAAAELSTADVVDAAKELDSALVEAWLGDRQQRFTLNAHDLRAMHQSNVSEGVIDMMVALSNPQYFTLMQNGAPAARDADPFQRPRGISGATLTQQQMAILAQSECMARYGRGSAACGVGMMDWSDFFFPWSGYQGFRGYNGYYNSYYNGYNVGWGAYGPLYGGSLGGWYGGNGGYVVVPVAPKDPEQPGRVINGQGYSQGGASGGSQAEPRSPSVGSTTSGGWSSGGGGSTSGGGSATSGGGGGASSGGSSTGGGEQRTAKPRP